jgi:hypothetical protein
MHLEELKWSGLLCERGGRGVETTDVTARTTKRKTPMMSGDIVEEEHTVDA